MDNIMIFLPYWLVLLVAALLGLKAINVALDIAIKYLDRKLEKQEHRR